LHERIFGSAIVTTKCLRTFRVPDIQDRNCVFSRAQKPKLRQKLSITATLFISHFSKNLNGVGPDYKKKKYKSLALHFNKTAEIDLTFRIYPRLSGRKRKRKLEK
jgi:hypothetical protein